MTRMPVKNIYGRSSDGQVVYEYTVTNAIGVEIKILNLGCTITSIKIPDRKRQLCNIVLGYDTLEEYLRSGHYVGCVIGRYANRISKGRLEIDGRFYSLTANQFPHHLHGGNKGFDKAIWRGETYTNEIGSGVEFTHISPDGDEGYPGTLRCTVNYFLSADNRFHIQYRATTDMTTVINPTQHSYFNLVGNGDVLEHQLEVNGNYFLPVDKYLIPTGEFRPVKGTPFDLTKLVKLGARLKSGDQQTAIARGFDHTWILQKTGEELSYAATLYEPGSGRKIEVWTTEPGLQVYTANAIEGKGRNGPLRPHSGICLETQHFPDSPNRNNFPTVLLQPGSTFESTTQLKFSVED